MFHVEQLLGSWVLPRQHRACMVTMRFVRNPSLADSGQIDPHNEEADNSG